MEKIGDWTRYVLNLIGQKSVDKLDAWVYNGDMNAFVTATRIDAIHPTGDAHAVHLSCTAAVIRKIPNPGNFI